MKSHQRIIRERMASIGAGNNLFGAWWASIDTAIEAAILKEISIGAAAEIVHDYEYLGTMPNAPIKAYGIYWSGNIAGTVVFGSVSPPSVSRSVMPEGIHASVIQLSRGACVHWAHEHAASKLISYALKQIRHEGWRVVIAYADPTAGEIGTVYQATNWLYCGKTAARPDYIRPDGTTWRGHMKKGVAASLPKKARVRKGRYVYLLGSKKEKRQLLGKLQWSIRPYPKRHMEQEIHTS